VTAAHVVIVAVGFVGLLVDLSFGVEGLRFVE